MLLCEIHCGGESLIQTYSCWCSLLPASFLSFVFGSQQSEREVSQREGTEGGLFVPVRGLLLSARFTNTVGCSITRASERRTDKLSGPLRTEAPRSDMDDDRKQQKHIFSVLRSVCSHWSNCVVGAVYTGASEALEKEQKLPNVTFWLFL